MTRISNIQPKQSKQNHTLWNAMTVGTFNSDYREAKNNREDRDYD